MIPCVAILSGGLATRLKPITEKIPKAMVEIAGKPFVHWQLKLMKEKGFSNIVICAGHLGDQIKNYAGDGSEFGLTVDYSFDGAVLLGTGGAIRKALPLLGDKFGIMYGDSYLNIDFEPIFRYFNTNNKKGLMTVIKNDNQWDKSNVIYHDGSVVKYDKKNITDEMRYIDYGFAILKKDSFADIEGSRVIDLADVYKDLVDSNEMLGYEVCERFYEIGSLKGMEETERYIKNKYHVE